MKFSERLKNHLDIKGWKPIRLASELSDRGVDVYPQTIDRWLDGTSEPRLIHARAIADAFGIDLDTLYPSEPAKT